MKPKPEMIADKRLRHDVEQQLEYDTEVTSTAIGVGAEHGVVTLSGYVDTYTQKIAAEQAAHKANGVKGVANDLVIRPLFKITDTEIATAAAAAISSDPHIPETVELTVKDGRVYLEGTAARAQQSDVAEKVVSRIPGVMGVFNRISVKPVVAAAGIKEKIEDLFLRHAELDAQAIAVTVVGNTVELWGKVRDSSEKDEAERAARSAPGVEHVRDHLQIVP